VSRIVRALAHTNTGKTGAGFDSGAGCNANKCFHTQPVRPNCRGPAHYRAGRAGPELDKPGAGQAAGGRLVSFNVTASELAHVSEPVGAGRLFEIPQSV
jgi:hypothetical protein